jgi:hypothetical protein
MEVELPVSTVIESLSKEVQCKRPFWPNPFADDRKKFKGFLSGGTFRIIRNIYYLNSFLPTIKGNVSESKTGSIVSVTMNSNLAVLTAFMLVPAFGGFFLTTFFTQPGFVITAVTVAGLLIGYCLYTFGFMMEQAIDKKVLTDVLSKKNMSPNRYKASRCQ